jgi:hypothetical protein
MRVGVRSSVVVARRLDSVARQTATIVREATSGGDPNAVGRFLGSFGGYLTGQLELSSASSSGQLQRSASTSAQRRKVAENT